MRETSPEEAEEAREAMEKMSCVYNEAGHELYLGKATGNTIKAFF